MTQEKSDTQNVTAVSSGDLRDKLQGYRQSAGYTLEQMSEALCLSEDILTNLENENFTDLPAAPYVRGYLRNYAKLAEVESDELIKIFETLRGADPKELIFHAKKPIKAVTGSPSGIFPILTQVFFLALLVAVLFGISKIPGVNKWIGETWDSFSAQTNTQEIDSTNKPLLTGSMPIPTPLLNDSNETKDVNANKKPTTNEEEVGEKENSSLKEGSKTSSTTSTAPTTTAISSNEKSVDNSSTLKGASNKKTSELSEKSLSKKIESVSNGNDIIESLNQKLETTKKSEDQQAINNQAITSTPKAVDSDEITLKLVFTKEVWLRIRGKDNKTLFEGISYKGDEKNLVLKKPLTFRVGNAQGLSLFVDNKAVDISNYISGSIANFTLQK